MENKQKINIVRVLIKAVILFIVINLLWAVLNPEIGYFSIYSHLVPGRARFPFGEVPQLAYNFSLDNFDAMFESHEIEGTYQNDEYSVFVVGDSSVWGTLLKPEENLAGQLNQLNLTHVESGLPIRFYNFGYPTLSLTKDVMVIAESLSPYNPDMIIWMVTLESMPWKLQQRSPIVSNNPERLHGLSYWYGLPIERSGDSLEFKTFWEKTIVGQRRELADIIRLQLYGFLWGATGIDQYYPGEYTAASTDLKADDSYYEFTPETIDESQFAFEMIEGAVDIALENTGTKIMIVNEPILISEGENSEIRYNFYYPRWIYDIYRGMMIAQSDINEWDYLDLWDIIPASEFTNSAIHLTPAGEHMLASELFKQMNDKDLWDMNE